MYTKCTEDKIILKEVSIWRLLYGDYSEITKLTIRYPCRILSQWSKDYIINLSIYLSFILNSKLV